VPDGSLLAFPDIEEEGHDQNGRVCAIVSFHLDDSVDGNAAGGALEKVCEARDLAYGTATP